MGQFSELLKIEDCKLFQYFIVAYNNTSGSSIIDYKKIELVSLAETTLSLTLPKNSCAVGHSLTLYVSSVAKNVKVKKLTNNQTLPGTYAFTAKVDHLGTAADGLISAEMHLTNFTRSEWEEITKKYFERQQQINALFQALRKAKEFEGK